LICSYIGGRGGLCDNNRGGDLYMLSLLLEDMFSIYNLSSRFLVVSVRYILKRKTPLILWCFLKRYLS